MFIRNAIPLFVLSLGSWTSAAPAPDGPKYEPAALLAELNSWCKESYKNDEALRTACETKHYQEVYNHPNKENHPLGTGHTWTGDHNKDHALMQCLHVPHGTPIEQWPKDCEHGSSTGSMLTDDKTQVQHV